MFRRLNPIVTLGVPRDGGALTFPTVGQQWFVDSVNGRSSFKGDDFTKPAKYVEQVFDRGLASDEIIYVKGDIREQIVAPLGVYGVKIVGMSGGRTRHDGGVRWRETATAPNTPLITIREQGWEFHNILFVPKTGYSAIKAHRAENATYPDSSHFIVKACKFIGNVAFGSYAGMGIEDYGGNHHYLVEDCEFASLSDAIMATNVSIASPLRNIIRRCTFDGNQEDIGMNGSRCIIEGNFFRTAYVGTHHVTTINMALTGDAATGNLVINNVFADAAANVTIAKGYKPSTGDVWRNFVTDAADAVVAVPA